MTLIALASGRSPGLTTTVQALALTWPADRRTLIAELDPDGASLAARQAVPSDPGLVSFAAAGRRGFEADDVLGHCRQLADGTVVLLGPTSPDRSASALATIGGRFGAALDALPGFDVLADCGRLDSRSPVLEVVSSAPYVLLVVEPTVEGVAHVAARLPVPVPAGRVALVTVGDRPYRSADVAQVLGLPVLGVIARDPRGAAQVAEGRPNRRSPLLRSAAELSAALAAYLPANTGRDPARREPARPDDPAGPDRAGRDPAGADIAGGDPGWPAPGAEPTRSGAYAPDADPLGDRSGQRRWP